MADVTLNRFNHQNIVAALGDLPLGGFRYYETISSTNDLAISWANEGASDLSLILANQQTAGRGRSGRPWLTPLDAALAFSLVLRLRARERESISLFSGLGALIVCLAVERLYGVRPSIKWPNDVLLDEKKFCGILSEVSWIGDKAQFIILGIGINTNLASIPSNEEIDFPATSLESQLGYAPDRIFLLQTLIKELIAWRGQIAYQRFINVWESRLAYRDRPVEVHSTSEFTIQGVLRGLGRDGCLQLLTEGGKVVSVHFGDVHLRPRL